MLTPDSKSADIVYCVDAGPSHTMMANSAICAIHIYHCIAFKLSVSDIVHHLVFGEAQMPWNMPVIIFTLGIHVETKGLPSQAEQYRLYCPVDGKYT